MSPEQVFISRVREVLAQPYKATGIVTLIQSALSDLDKAAGQAAAYAGGVADTADAVTAVAQQSGGASEDVFGLLRQLGSAARQQAQPSAQPAPQPNATRSPLALPAGTSTRPAAHAFGQASRR
jgi:hypothetical protein